MTEKQSFSDQIIIGCLNANYGIQVAALTLLPLGAERRLMDISGLSNVNEWDSILYP